MQLSRQATRKIKLGRAIEATMELNQTKARTGLESFFHPVARADEPVDLMAPIVMQREKMTWCRELVVETDLAHQLELGKLAKYIAQRNSLSSEVSKKLVRIRRVGRGLLGEDEFVETGLDGAVSQDPEVIARQGKKVTLAFAQPGLELESSAWVRAKIEVEDLLDGLDADVEALEAVLGKVSLHRRRVEDTAEEKRQALDGFNESYLLIGRSTEACFRMAGMPAAAERVRTATRRLASSEDDEEPAQEAGSSDAVEEHEAGETSTAPDEESSKEPLSDGSVD